MGGAYRRRTDDGEYTFMPPLNQPRTQPLTLAAAAAAAATAGS
jgi:hypothetical protein